MVPMSRGSAVEPGTFTYRDVNIYRPFDGEVPVDLVGDEGAADDVRVAKLHGRVVGAYRLARLDHCRFEIAAIGVYAGFRRRGVGRWLLGHALGIAESRGGRIVEAPRGAEAFFRAAGFAPCRGRFRLRLTPE